MGWTPAGGAGGVPGRGRTARAWVGAAAARRGGRPAACARWPATRRGAAGPEAIRRAGVPVLVVSGDHLPAIERVCDRLADALEGDRAVIAGRGHAIPRADGFNERLEAFWTIAEASAGRARHADSLSATKPDGGAGMAKVRFTLDGDVGEIVIDDPPLNLFGLELARDLADAASPGARQRRPRDPGARRGRQLLRRGERGDVPRPRRGGGPRADRGVHARDQAVRRDTGPHGGRGAGTVSRRRAWRWR